jgi:hypothetical protein
MKKAHKKIGLLGIFEDYSNRSTGPAFLTTQNLECGPIKKEVAARFENDCTIICDPFYIFPAAATFGIKNIDVNLTYLYTQMATELYKQGRERDIICTHSVLDIYTEIVIHHGRAKWLEPLLSQHLSTYSMLLHVPIEMQSGHTLHGHKYDALIRRFMHDFKANYYRLSEGESITDVIYAHLNYVPDKSQELPAL